MFQYSSAMSVFFCRSLPSIGQTCFWLFLCNCAHMASMLKSPLNWYGFLQVSFNKAASWEAVRQLFSNVWLWLACPLGQLSDRISLHFSMKYIKLILEKVGEKRRSIPTLTRADVPNIQLAGFIASSINATVFSCADIIGNIFNDQSAF